MGPLCLNLPPPLAAGFPVLPGKTPDLPETGRHEPGHGSDAPEGHGVPFCGDNVLNPGAVAASF